MATVVVISQKACRKLGRSISEKTYTTLTDTVKNEILMAAHNYAMISQRGKISVEFALLSLVKDAEKCAALAVSPESQGEIFFAEDFDQPLKAPPDMAPSSVHLHLALNGSQTAKPVSYQHPNFLLAPGVEREKVSEDIDRLVFLIPTLKYIGSQFDTQLFWVYASLESGVHISYPGHGGYPDGYDPRQRPWYRNAWKHKGLFWSSPIPDATTNQLTFTVSAPFHGPDGSMAGVAAIDVLIPNVLLKSEISSQWSQAMRSFMVSREKKKSGEMDTLWVLGQQREGNPASKTDSASDPVKTGKEADFSELAAHFEKAPSGCFEAVYDGVDSFWAFANIFPDLFFVIVVPKSAVLDLPNAVTRLFLDYTQTVTFISGVAVVIVLVLVAGIAFFISRASSRHVMESVNAFKGLARGDFSVRIRHRYSDERDLVRTTFNTIVPKLEEHLRMSNALFVAQEVQQSLLPTKNPVLEGFDIAGISDYCDETGGDYYDFIPTSQNRLAVVVGDVSGHGVSSALLMATARALIMLRASMPGPAAKIISDVNKQLSLDTSHTGNFMTFFYCELTPNKTEVNWVRAGHDPALIYDPVGDNFDELKGHGCALGLDGNLEYEEFQRTLNRGDIILIGTDGIWEMYNDKGEMFGKQRLKQVIRDSAQVSAQEILAAITGALNEFRGYRQPEDDVTMVVIRVDQQKTVS
jgi:sigma-B regulation protein RsbU (phosphoserine phosphatase)